MNRKSGKMVCSRERPGVDTDQLIYTLCRKVANPCINDQSFNGFLQMSSEQKKHFFAVSGVSFAVGV